MLVKSYVATPSEISVSPEYPANYWLNILVSAFQNGILTGVVPPFGIIMPQELALSFLHTYSSGIQLFIPVSVLGLPTWLLTETGLLCRWKLLLEWMRK